GEPDLAPEIEVVPAHAVADQIGDALLRGQAAPVLTHAAHDLPRDFDRVRQHEARPVDRQGGPSTPRLQVERVGALEQLLQVVETRGGQVRDDVTPVVLRHGAVLERYALAASG